MSEEAEALLHASKSMNKTLKTLLTLSLILVISLVEYGITNAVVSGFDSVEHWVAMLMDSASLTFPFIFFGLYTKLPFHVRLRTVLLLVPIKDCLGRCRTTVMQTNVFF
jgi:hypothetical protein